MLFAIHAVNAVLCRINANCKCRTQTLKAHEALKCSDMSCSIHQKDIDCFYCDIVNIIHRCVRKCIFVKKQLSKHSFVSYNENVKHYHVIARSEFKF